MKTQSTALYILRLALTLLVITAVVAAALAGVNGLTADRIAQIQAEKTQKAIAEVLSDAPAELTATPVNEGIVKTLYACPAGYAVEVAPAGFGGEITMMVGIVDGKVTGISVISHAETPGLGDVAASTGSAGATFREQFKGAEGGLAVSKDGGTIDAITSATITSRAVTAGVNAALDYVAKLG